MATSKHLTCELAPQHPFGSNKTEFDTHGQQLMSYCPSHLMPCCDECISQNHSKCTGVTSLESVVEKTKIEKSKETVGKDINNILQFLDKITNNKSENIQKGEKQYQSIKESISEIRIGINKHLNNLETKICKESDTVWGEEKSRLIFSITEIGEKKKRLQEMKNDLRKVQEHTPKLESFLGVHQIEQQVHQFQLYVEQNETVREVDLKIKKNDETRQILSKLQSVTSIGEIKVDITESIMKKDISVGREAQIESQSNINNMKMNIVTKIKIDAAFISSVIDIIVLLDGRVVVVEDWGRVYILTSDGKLQKQLPNYGRAWSVTQINDDTLAITYPREKSIKLLNMENETITKVITLDETCLSIFYSNNALVVALSKNEIRIIDLEGNTQKSIEVQSKSHRFHLVHWKDRVIYGDPYHKAVTCIDGSGKQIWQYQHDLLGLNELCVDTYGNIIVADQSSNRIIVISKDGQLE